MLFKTGNKESIFAWLICLIALLMALSACSAGAKESPAASQAATAAGPVQEVKVSMGDFFYDPRDIMVKSGKVRFLLTNAGATAHRFSIKNGDTLVATSKNVGAGRESTLDVDLTAGNYHLGCTLGDHEKRGSVGSLTVQ